MKSCLINDYGETIEIDYSTQPPTIEHSDCGDTQHTFFYFKRSWRSIDGGFGYLYSENFEHNAMLSDNECMLIEKDLAEHEAKPVQLVIYDKVAELSYPICPLCLTQYNEDLVDGSWGDGHHVIWKSEGGCDKGTNVLMICRDCHGKMTREGVVGQLLSYLCSLYMFSEIGLPFVEQTTNWPIVAIETIKEIVHDHGVSKAQQSAGAAAWLGLEIATLGKAKHIRQLGKITTFNAMYHIANSIKKD